MFKPTIYSNPELPRSLQFKPQLIRILCVISALLATDHASAGCNNNQLAAAGAYYSSQIIDIPPIDIPTIPIDPNYPIPPTTPNPDSPIYDAPCPSDIVSITPDQVFGMGSMATRVTGGKLNLPSDHFNLKQASRQGGGAGDFDFPALNFWSKIDTDFGSTDTTFTQPGFAFDKENFMFGADYRIKDNWVAGGTFTYGHNSANFNASRGETTTNSYTGMLYTSYYITDAAHVEATASYGGFDYETSRNITFAGQSSIATAKPQGNRYAFSWGGGYDFNFDAWTVAPYARGEYMGLDIDSYSESGSPFAVSFGKQNIESLTSTLGVQSAYTFSVPWGVLIPQVRGEWHHQFLDGQRQVQASFVSISNSNFVMNSGGPSRDYFTVGGEVSTVLPGGVSAFLSYESLQGYTSVNSNKFVLGARMEF